MTGAGAADRLGRSPDGLLRFDAGRDLAAVIALLELGFGDDLEERDRRWLKDLAALSAAGPLVGLALRLVPGAVDGLGGYVLYEAGRLIGNVSVLRAGPDSWVIANVVTHPLYRRRGIADRLMAEALGGARQRGARRVQLQVRDTNAAAKALYERLGFRVVGASTLLRLPGGAQSAARTERTGRDGDDGPSVAVRPWRRAAPGRVAHLVARSGDAGRAGPPSLVRQTARRGALKGRLDDWLHGRTRHRWAAVADGDVRALAVVDAYHHGGVHRLDVVVDPAWRGRVEVALVEAALACLSAAPGTPVEADVAVQDGPLRAALVAAGFEPQRTLERMELWLGSR